MASKCQPVVVATAIQPVALAVNATHVYWTEAYGGVDRAPEILASGLAQPAFMAQDATALYWTADAAVMKLAK